MTIKLKSATRADLDQTTHRLDQTHTEVESVKNKLEGKIFHQFQVK